MITIICNDFITIMMITFDNLRIVAVFHLNDFVLGCASPSASVLQAVCIFQLLFHTKLVMCLLLTVWDAAASMWVRTKLGGSPHDSYTYLQIG